MSRDLQEYKQFLFREVKAKTTKQNSEIWKEIHDFSKTEMFSNGYEKWKEAKKSFYTKSVGVKSVGSILFNSMRH